MNYQEFLESKAQLGGFYGFEPIWMPDFLFDFQKALVQWALKKGKAAIFADCGLGKTPMQLVWAENVIRQTNKRVLILTPLAVSAQTIQEAKKFDIECQRSRDGRFDGAKIIVTNYEQLENFNHHDFIGVVCDESSILKNFDGVRKKAITEFMRQLPYRLLCTATAAPNDYIELGTSSEALGELGHMDMLTRFFRNVDGSTLGGSHGFRFKHKDRLDAFQGKKSFWRFKHHAEQPFWRWVTSWARALRRPSDMQFNDDGFLLPPLIEQEIMIENTKTLPGELFFKPAIGLKEQRQERRVTIEERCQRIIEVTKNHSQSLIWCHLNDEGDLLEEIIPDSLQVAGKHSDEIKEERLLAFASGQLKRLITKPKVAGFGLNFQNCSHVTFFPSHSFEQYYQGVRRCWRYGQKKSVIVDVITTPGEANVVKNLQRKAQSADKMFSSLVHCMNDSLQINRGTQFEIEEEIPSWL